MRENMGQGKSSMSDISSASDTDYEAKKSVEGTDRLPTRSDSIRESSSSLTPCPFLGERPETFYSTIAVPVMKFANILELAGFYERMLVPLSLVQGNWVTPYSHL